MQARATKSAEVGGLEEEKKVAQNQWSIAQEQVQSLGTELAKQLSAVFDAKIAGLQHSIDSLQTSLAPKKLPALVTGLVQAQAVELKEEHSRVAQTHVVSRVDEIQSIDAVVDNFLSTTKRVLLVWGAPGGGKHDACIHTLARLSDRVEDTGVAPVYVDVPALMNPTKGLLRETLTNYYIFRDEDVATVRREARLVLLLDGFDEIDLRQNLLLTNQLDRWERVQFIIFCSTSILQTVPDCRKFFTLNGSVADDKMIECSLQGFDDRQASLFVDKFLARGGHDPAIKEAVLRELRPHLANPCMSQFLLESVVENWGQICGAGWTEQEKKTISSGCSKKWCQRKQLKLLRAGKSYEDQEEEIKKAVNGFEPLANLDQAWKLGDNAEQSAIKAEPALKKAVVTAGIRSGGGNRSIRASFGSEIEEASNLYWIDQFGRDVDYGQVSSLFPAICQNSYISHAWKFVDKNGRVQAVFRADGIQYMYNVTLTSSTMESVSDSLAVRLSTEKSSECKVPTVFSVQNNSDEALEVFWLGYDHKSKPKTRGVIEPGELLNIDTFISHAFRICAKGQIQKPAATIVAALASIRLEVFSG